MARRIESLMLDGPAGPIEALLEEPDAEPTQAVLVCHPHPLHHGSLHNKVVYRIAHGFRRAGAVALRFNFRGVGKSGGIYDHGVGEIEDARAALMFLLQRYPGLPYSIAGFSFGSRVAMQLGCGLGSAPGVPKPVRIVPVGVPVLRTRFEGFLDCPVPRFFVQSTGDEYGPVADMEAVFARCTGEKRLTFVESEDHFFKGGLEELERVVERIAGEG